MLLISRKLGMHFVTPVRAKPTLLEHSSDTASGVDVLILLNQIFRDKVGAVSPRHKDSPQPCLRCCLTDNRRWLKDIFLNFFSWLRRRFVFGTRLRQRDIHLFSHNNRYHSYWDTRCWFNSFIKILIQFFSWRGIIHLGNKILGTCFLFSIWLIQHRTSLVPNKWQWSTLSILIAGCWHNDVACG